MNIYIATSLTHIPREHFETYVESIHKLANHIKELGHDVKYALINSDPQLEEIVEEKKAEYCYLWDRQMVEESNLIIAECSFSSVGLGIELQIAEGRNIPAILLFKDFGDNRASEVGYQNPDKSEHRLQIGKGYISLMALGLPNVNKVIQYSEIEDCFTELNFE
ncbi:hypothetical protein [Chryseobacterium sp. KCF3-3]|jgi:hypothetical protein|uniref:hypothetical protein n=1 Tax=Chryseobacterium sp. KCF3-3 TaxID=3231511 RepID=UPI0038B2EAF8